MIKLKKQNNQRKKGGFVAAFKLTKNIFNNKKLTFFIDSPIIHDNLILISFKYKRIIR